MSNVFASNVVVQYVSSFNERAAACVSLPAPFGTPPECTSDQLTASDLCIRKQLRMTPPPAAAAPPPAPPHREVRTE